MPALPIITPSPNVPASKALEGELRLGHVHGRVREHRHVPGDQHGQQRLRADRQREAVLQVGPVAAARGRGRLQQPLRDAVEEDGRDQERAGVDPVGRVDARSRDERAAGQRAERPGEVVHRLQQGVGAREVLVLDEVRQPGVGGRPEEAGRDAGDRGEGDDLRRARREGQRGEDAEADEVGARPSTGAARGGRSAARRGCRSRRSAACRRSAARRSSPTSACASRCRPRAPRAPARCLHPSRAWRERGAGSWARDPGARAGCRSRGGGPSPRTR